MWMRGGRKGRPARERERERGRESDHARLVVTVTPPKEEHVTSRVSAVPITSLALPGLPPPATTTARGWLGDAELAVLHCPPCYTYGLYSLNICFLITVFK